MAMNEKDLGMLMAHIGANVKQWDAAMTQMQQDMANMEQKSASSMDRINQQIQHVGQRAQQAGMLMSKFITLPLAGAGTAAFHFAKTFESSMSNIEGLVGASSQQIAEWAEQIIELGPQVAKTPQELADGLFFVTSAGFQGAEAMRVLEIAAKASTAGLGETKVVADLVTSAINAYGIQNLNAAQAADILTAAVREGKAEAPALAASMGQVLPVASELGVGFDEIGAAIAAMTRTGTDAATASTQLRAILVSLLSPSQQAEQALSQMGFTSDDLRNMLRGPDGLVTVLTTLRQATAGNSEAMAQVFNNVRALSGVLDIVGANAEENTEIFKSLQDSTGALDHAFESAQGTIEFKWNQALSASTTALTELGLAMKNDAVPLLEAVSKTLVDLTSWFKSLDESTRVQIIRWGAFTAAVGPALVVLGTMANVVLPGLITSAGLARGAVVGLTRAMMANPWMAAIAGVTTLTIWLTRSLVKMRDQRRELEAIRNIRIESAGFEELEMLTNRIGDLTEQIQKQTIEDIQRGGAITQVTKALMDEREELEASKAAIEERLGITQQTTEATGGYGTALENLLATMGTTNREATGYTAVLQKNDERIQELITSTGDFTNAMLAEVIALRTANAQIRETIELRDKLAEVPEKPSVPVGITDPGIFDPVIDLSLNTAPAEGSIAYLQALISAANYNIQQTTDESWRQTMMASRDHYQALLDSMTGLESQQQRTGNSLINWGQTAGQVFDRLAFQGEKFSAVLKSILRQLAVQKFTQLAMAFFAGPTGGASALPGVLSMASPDTGFTDTPRLSYGTSMTVGNFQSMSTGNMFRNQARSQPVQVTGEIVADGTTLRVLIQNAQIADQRLS